MNHSVCLWLVGLPLTGSLKVRRACKSAMTVLVLQWCFYSTPYSSSYVFIVDITHFRDKTQTPQARPTSEDPALRGGAANCDVSLRRWHRLGFI